MTTKTIDTAYAMLQKLSPLRAFPHGTPTDPLAKRVAKRWAVIAPWVLIEARRALDPAEAFSHYRRAHEDYLRRLLIAGISMRAIALKELDSPLSPPAYFDQLLRWAIDRKSHKSRAQGLGREFATRSTKGK